MPKEKPAYYGILPANVRYDKRLKANEKIMFTEITTLANKNGYCSASNYYFSDLYEVDKKTISKWINDLKKYGYALIEYDRKEKQIVQRRIYPITNPKVSKMEGIHQKMDTSPSKNGEGYPSKDEDPIHQKAKGNNTRVNNTSNNNTRKNKESVRSSDSVSDIHEALSFYQDNIGMISPYQADQLQSYAKDFSTEMIIEAIKVALNKNAKSINYIKGVLNRWNDKNIRSIEQMKADNLEHKKQYSNNKNNATRDKEQPDEVWSDENGIHF